MSEKNIPVLTNSTIISVKDLKEHITQLPDDRSVIFRTYINRENHMPELHIIIPMERVALNGTN